MRILVESPSFNPFEGSNAAVGYGWAKHIARHHEVHVVAYGPSYDRGGAAPEIPNLTVIRIPATRARKLGTMSDYVVTATRMRSDIMRRVRPDIVHAVEPGGWLGPRVFPTSRIPSVIGPLNGGAALPSKRFMDQVLESLPVTPARAFTAGGPRKLAVTLFNEALFGNIGTSKMLAHRAMRSAKAILLATPLTPGAIPGTLASRVHRMPLTGLDLEAFAPRAAAKRARETTVLYAGRIVSSKGLHLVVEAAARAGVGLRIAGAAPPQDEWYVEHCRSLVDRLGVGDRVRWLGVLPRDALVEEYAAADVYCMLSLWEPFGMTYIEAMACGTPVIGLRAGGVTEIVEEGTGWLVEPTDPSTVVADTARIMADVSKDEFAASGARARHLVAARYSWDRMLGDLLRIYGDIAA